MRQLGQLRRISDLRQTKIDRLTTSLANARKGLAEAEEAVAEQIARLERLRAHKIDESDFADSTVMADPATRFAALAQAIEQKRMAEVRLKMDIEMAQGKVANAQRNMEWLSKLLMDAEGKKKSIDTLVGEAARRAQSAQEALDEDRALEQHAVRAAITPGQSERAEA